MFPWYLIFLKRSLVFPILLFSSISLHWSLKKAFLSLLAILWNSAFRCLYLFFSPLLFASLLFTVICKAFLDSHFAFLHFFFFGMVLIPVSYTISRTSFHSSSGTLSIRSRPLNLFLTPLYNHGGFRSWRRLSAEELMLLNCGVGEDSWESLGLQGDPTSPFSRRSMLGFLWKEWY